MDRINGLAAVAVLITAVGYALFDLASTVEADFHEVQIEEIMTGAFGNDAVEFVEVKMLKEGQNCAAGGKAIGDSFACLPPTLTDGARLVFFDGSGNQSGEFIFPANLPNGQSGRSILIGTAEFTKVFTVQPDFIMPSNIASPSGKVCYKNVAGASSDVTQCVSYGDFTGNTEGFGSPAVALPITASSSLIRTATSFNNANDFRLAIAAPKNNNDEIGGLAFAAGPRTTKVGLTIAPPVRVEVLDALGTRITTATGSITISIGTNPGAGVLSGTTTVLPVDGVATFFDLRIDEVGEEYTLLASARNFTEATSDPFDILACQVGDASGDDKINALDITTIELIVVGTLPEIPCADANRDGRINALDITSIEILVATAPSTASLKTTPPSATV